MSTKAASLEEIKQKLAKKKEAPPEDPTAGSAASATVTEPPATMEKSSTTKSSEPTPKEELSPLEAYRLFRTNALDLLKTDLKRFHLKIQDCSETECILYQGTLGNVWARFNIREKIFYRVVIEKQFERAGLVVPSNDIVRRR